MSTEPQQLVVTGKETLADGVVRLTLARPDRGPLTEWEPGAHLDLYLGDLVRQYSLCSDPADRNVYQVAVLRERESRGGSSYVHETLTEDDSITVSGPRNNFDLIEAKRYLFVAGGIGITPIRPMIAAAEAAGADWTLLYGGRTAASMAFTDELLAIGGDRVSLRPQDEFGLLDLDGLLAEPDPETLVYCCGPEPLLQAIEAQCTSWPHGALHVERFAPAEGALEGPNFEFEVEFRRSGVTVTVPADRSILQAGLDSGLELDSSCTEGTCSTCETDVLAGVPDHRDSVLSDEEKQEGDTMMICVSRACTARLVLDA